VHQFPKGISAGPALKYFTSFMDSWGRAASELKFGFRDRQVFFVTASTNLMLSVLPAMGFPGVVPEHVPGTLGEHGMFPVPCSLFPVH